VNAPHWFSENWDEKVMIGRTAIYAIMLLAVTVTSQGKAAAPAGENLAERWCSQCHAVKPNQVSTNPKAPPFLEVAARPSSTDYTLRVFLNIQHIEMPNFILKPDDADALVDYILSMKPKR
jgi:mono/diheme cytochrome c family protein